MLKQLTKVPLNYLSICTFHQTRYRPYPGFNVPQQIQVKQLDAVWVKLLKTKFQRKQKDQLLGYESSEFGYEWPGYETTVGTKQLASVHLRNRC